MGQPLQGVRRRGPEGMGMKRVVVIPTYNEACNIEALVRAVHACLPDLDIIIVDDGSPDGTGQIAESLEGVQVIHRPCKQGLGSAYVAGYKRALEQGYEQIGGMDADFSHDPRDLPALFGLLRDCDVAIGSRYVPRGGTRNWSVRRRLLSYGANLLAKLCLRMPIQDVTGAFRVVRRAVLEAANLDEFRCQGYAFGVELLYRSVQLGFRVCESPILFVDRRLGQSKICAREITQGAATLFRLRFGT